MVLEMALENSWPYFALIAAMMALIHLPIFRFVDTAVVTRVRYVTLDGLRGYLAFSVFVFNIVVSHRFIATGIWAVPDSSFYALLGPLGVSLFFMITGFLFWTKMLSARGKPNWRALYIGRLFRIAPMYLFVVIAMLLIVLFKTGFELRVSLGALATSILQWLAIGILNFQPDVNGYRATHILAGVTWTIAYEWAFYASLLVTAYFARGRSHLTFVASALALCIAGRSVFNIDALGFSAIFLCGMTVASLLHEKRTLPLSDYAASSIALVCLALIFAGDYIGRPNSGYGTPETILLGIFFYLVCSGTSLLGLLTTRAAHRLGNISYSLYLLQGLALKLIFAVDPLREFAMSGTLNYWIAGLLCAFCLTIAASLTYFFVELRGIHFGKKVALASARKSKRRTPVATIVRQLSRTLRRQ